MPIGILNLKLWTEIHLTPLNRYLRPKLSFISEETLIVSSVTRSSPLEMLFNVPSLLSLSFEANFSFFLLGESPPRDRQIAAYK